MEKIQRGDYLQCSTWFGILCPTMFFFYLSCLPFLFSEIYRPAQDLKFFTWDNLGWI